MPTTTINYSGYAKFIPNILNNPFIRSNLGWIILIILGIIVIIRILTKPRMLRAMSQYGRTYR